MVDPRLEVRLLGPVDVRFDGEPLRVDTRKAVAVLAYLVATGRPASRGALAALLWPDSDDESARGALRRTLSVLNTATAGVVLQIERASVGINEAQVRADLAEASAAMAVARSHKHLSESPCESCLTALTRVRELDRGVFMDGFVLRDSEPFEEWQRAETEHYAREIGAALERLARLYAVAGRWDPALGAARRWLELDTLHEPAHRLLMTIHARAGEVGAAIAQYRDCLGVLHRELGVAPLPETTALYESIREGRLEAPVLKHSEPVALAPQLRRRTLPLVGRDAALGDVIRAHAGAAAGGRVVAVVGEAGIGKTRLMATVAERVAAAGGRAIGATAYAGEEGIAYGLVLGLIRAGLADPGAPPRIATLPPHAVTELDRLAPGLIEQAEPERGRAAREGAAAHLALLDAISLLLEALVGGEVPGLIRLDGIESADASSLEALTYLVRRLEGRRIVVMAAWRPEDLTDRAASFARLLESSPNAMVIGLDRLDAEAVATLVRELRAGDADFSQALFAESEGLPLYLAEVLAAGPRSSETLPSGMRALVRERLGSLEPIAEQILSTAAVIGRTFDFATVRQASGRSEEEAVDAIDALVRRGLVRELDAGEGAVRYDFAHRAFRDAAHDATSLARRRLLHGRVADAIRAGPARTAPERLERLAVAAGHERAAGRRADAARAFEEAGRLARRLSAPRDAIAHFDSALALEHPDPAELHLAIGEARILLGEYAAAVQELETAAAQAEPALVARVELELGRAHGRRGDLAAAASHLEAAVVATDASGAARDDPIRAWIAAERAVVASRLGTPDVAETFAADALALAGMAKDERVRAAADRAAGLVAMASGDLAVARDRFRSSVQRSDSAGDAESALAARNALALAESADGRHAEAADLLEAALVECRRSGSRHLEAALENNLADALHRAGRSDESMEHLKRAVALFADVGGMPEVLAPDVWRLTSW